MTEVFEKLKAQLAATGTITDDELGNKALTDEERIWLSAERYSKQNNDRAKITLEAYVAANKTLDNTPEGSPEHEAAQKVVDEYEKQA